MASFQPGKLILAPCWRACRPQVVLWRCRMASRPSLLSADFGGALSTHLRWGCRSFASADEEKALLIMRKRMRHQARQRDDGMLGDFLLGFIEAHSESLDRQNLEDWQELMAVNDEFLMNLCANKIDVPKELDTNLLRQVKAFCAAGPVRPGLTGDNPWTKGPAGM
eukprot:TRINITY_DN47786_c0_g1_i1.p1 TRINITY_DN47786_c0_g1~~TRINITY_DN47786_c0_g1_i1.p1  ORF type:complete len:180 (-),score=35.34 TRINITY_DN47786_c0_g1_i1:14-511(-)